MTTKNNAVPAEIYQRVSGYYRPLKQWNKGKQAEFWDRKKYDVNNKRAEIEAK